MNFDRRKFLIRSIGTAICAGLAPSFIPSLLPEYSYDVRCYLVDSSGHLIRNNGPGVIYIGGNRDSGYPLNPGETILI